MKIAMTNFVALWAATTVCLAQQEMPKMPEPQKEHAWLMQLEGEWEADLEATMVPSKPPEKFKGTESARSLGGFWIVGENKSAHMGKPFTGIITLGYDPMKAKYVGAWVDSMSSTLWLYEGTLDENGKILTLDTEGPCPIAPGKIFKFKETIELKDKDHKVFTSTMQGDDGKWTTMMTINFRRQGSSAAGSSPSPSGSESALTNSHLKGSAPE
ncbi:MAG TPA: hypothetical protein DCZ95_04375 [Verrucomicrobia bacterium]|nr:hypothetical protein [Verrucomicrobiota bacterium]